MDEILEVREKRRRFVKRERIRRRLMKTGVDETICLQDWECEILLDWIKELEERVGASNGLAKV
jgi:SOS response regulatory protein OraA/RecX